MILEETQPRNHGTLEERITTLEDAVTEAAKATSPNKRYRPLGRPVNFEFMMKLKKICKKVVTLNHVVAREKHYSEIATLKHRTPNLDQRERKAVTRAFEEIDEFFDGRNNEDKLLAAMKKLSTFTKTSHLRKQMHLLSDKRRKAIASVAKGKQATTIKFFLEKEKKKGEVPPHLTKKIAAFFESIMSNPTQLSNEFTTRFPKPPFFAEPLIPDINVQDILTSMKKKARTPGRSKFSLKFIQKAPKAIQLEYAKLLVEIWKARRRPDRWTSKKLICLPKTANADHTQFRPISLLEDSRKLLLGVLIKKAFKPSLLSHTQHGFREGFSTDSASAILTDIIATAKRNKKPLIGITIDISKAFDSIPWSFLPEVLERCGVHREVTEYILDFERNGAAFIDETTLHSTAGVPQGSVEGPLLWNAFLNPLLLRLNQFTETEDFFDTNNIAFADDIVLLSKSEKGLELLLGEVSAFLRLTGMKLSSSKCEVFWNYRYQGKKDWPYGIAGTNPFQHLGRMISPLAKSTLNTTKNREMMSSMAKGAALLRKKRAPPEVISYIFNAVLAPKLAYAIRFDTSPGAAIEEFDLLYRKHFKLSLSLPPSTPNAFLHAPLGSWYAGIKPFSSYFVCTRATSLLRLVQGEYHTSNAAINLLKDKNFKTHKTSNMTLSFPIYLPKDYDPLKYLWKKKSLKPTVNAIRIRHHRNKEKIAIEILFDDQQTAFYEFTPPWEVGNDRTRIALSAYIFALRLNARFHFPQNCTFESDRINTTTLSYRYRKRVLSFNVKNNDLLSEVHRMIRISPLSVKFRNYVNLTPTAATSMRTAGLTTYHPANVHGAVQGKVFSCSKVGSILLRPSSKRPRSQT